MTAISVKEIEDAVARILEVTQGQRPIFCSADIFQRFCPDPNDNPNMFVYSPVLPFMSAFTVFWRDGEAEQPSADAGGTSDSEEDALSVDVEGFSYSVPDQALQVCYAYAAEAFFEAHTFFKERGIGAAGAPQA